MNAIATAYRRTLFAALLLAGLVVGLAMLEFIGLPAGAASGDTERVSVDSLGGEANGGDSTAAAISDDGRFVAFHSKATNLVANDTNGVRDVFVRDRQTGQTTRVSVDSLGGEVGGGGSGPAISGDGRFVAFASVASDLVAGDTNSVVDIFVHDRQTGQTTRVSVDSLGGEVDGSSLDADISDDGRFVAFTSHASNLVAGDANSVRDVFVHDRQTGQTTRVSVDSGGGDADDSSRFATISDDGRFVAFESDAPDLVPGDTNGFQDIFVRDRQNGQTVRVSVDNLGGQSDADSYFPVISDDGRFVAFGSDATGLVPGDTNGWGDIFVHDRQTSETTRVSLDSLGGEPNEESYGSTISDDGRFVAFISLATDLVPGDTNGFREIFVHDRQTGQTTRVSVDSLGGQANDRSVDPAISGDGRFVVFDAEATNLVPGDTNGFRDIFLHDRGVETNALWGDDDCNGAVAAVDALKNLQHVAAIDFTQNDPCFPLGETVGVSLAGVTNYPWGDIDCDQDVDAVDALGILRSIAAFPVSQKEGCPEIGSEVLVS
ncbi:MAG: calcium-binding protein [Chloroflexi bacterium]|nr:calcium-binding protein [Chloroflexota bacterium]